MSILNSSSRRRVNAQRIHRPTFLRSISKAELKTRANFLETFARLLRGALQFGFQEKLHYAL